MHNKDILNKLIKIIIIKPKIYILISDKSLEYIKKLVNEFNTIVKSINRSLNLPSSLSIDYLNLKDLIWDNTKIIIKNYPPSTTYYEFKLIYDASDSNQYEKKYVYEDGLDCCIYKKKVKKNIISMYIYQSSLQGLKKKNGFNIWEILPKIDYNLYCEINKCVRHIDTIILRCVLISKNKTISMEELFISILDGKFMHNQLELKIIYYDIDKNRYFNDYNNFKCLKEYNHNEDKDCNILLKYKNKKLILYIKNIIYDTIMNTNFNKDTLTYDIIFKNKVISLDRTYYLHYYNISDSIYYYYDNNKNIKLYTPDININRDIDISQYEFNYRLYNNDSLFIKLCISSYIINNFEDDILKINNNDIDIVIDNIKKINNKKLNNNLSKLLNKSIKEHMNDINVNCTTIKYDSNTKKFIGINSDIYDSIYKFIKFIHSLTNV